MKKTTTNAVEILKAEFPQPPVKSPGTRLLDMLCGWYEFIEKGSAPDCIDPQEVFTLYQSAWQAETPEAVEQFVKEKVLPILLKA